MTRRLDWERAKQRDSKRVSDALYDLPKTPTRGSIQARDAKYPSGCYACQGKIERGDRVYILHIPAGWRVRCGACGPFPADYEETLR